MKTSDVHIGTCYTCKVTHKLVIVEILSIHPKGGWNAKNLSTGKTIHIKSAQRLRGVAKKANTSPTVAKKVSSPSRRANKKKSTHTSQPVAHKRPTILDAAAKVLAQSAEPMNCRQIIETAIKKTTGNPTTPERHPKTPLTLLSAGRSKPKDMIQDLKKPAAGNSGSPNKTHHKKPPIMSCNF